MYNDNLSNEKAEFFMGREGLCLTTATGEDNMFLNILIFTVHFRKQKS